jgi:hypothetical protein
MGPGQVGGIDGLMVVQYPITLGGVMDAFAKMKNKFLELIEEKQIGAVPIHVRVRDLTPEEAIGTPEDRDYPLVKGRERLLEAEILGSRGQAFTDTPGDFSGTLKEVALLQLTDNRSRAVFIAALNALMRHLGLILPCLPKISRPFFV